MTLRSPTLFWRTFLLIVLLLVACLVAWSQSFRVFEREPRARQIAQQVISIVNITRSALLYSDPVLRRELLAELADNEGIRIVPREPGDVTQDLPDVPLVRMVSEIVRDRLGPQTLLAADVNGVPGNWVSFSIEEDAYWVYIERDPWSRDLGQQWIRWALIAALLSLIAAIAITGVVNRPLARLSRAARDLGAGRMPPPLPETGPAELRTVNESFNRMVADLDRLEQDRAVLLAGISHDLRTPLTRLRLEIEMSGLPDETREAMAGDIEQMDSIVRQFLDYARFSPSQPLQPPQRLDLSALVADAMTHHRLEPPPAVELAPGLAIDGHAVELQRALDNLVTNASRYGRSDDGVLHLTVRLTRVAQDAVLEVIDRGTGVPAADVERLLRPFQRGDASRGGGAGAGLGLAIVARIARLHRGRFELLPVAADGRGLCARLTLPLAR